MSRQEALEWYWAVIHNTSDCIGGDDWYLYDGLEEWRKNIKSELGL